ncbi:hypothetical protein EVAR_83344_1 [Eumeta japonica]|uniref:Uncharacterized protein n=1 Tax=Eumeta variegata TaxID=151549 RepID=A0A4C1VYD5_EUMVA|nr:hypothetical protein EVAR_83344_1 [Eumeta japonica]
MGSVCAISGNPIVGMSTVYALIHSLSPKESPKSNFMQQLVPSTVRRTKLRRSELPANEAMRRLSAPRPIPFLPRVPILRLYNAFVSNFTEFRTLYRATDNAT